MINEYLPLSPQQIIHFIPLTIRLYVWAIFVITDKLILSAGIYSDLRHTFIIRNSFSF